eukprot:scaffold53844_cov66-Phaeocystis_antarctica.AAC.3
MVLMRVMRSAAEPHGPSGDNAEERMPPSGTAALLLRETSAHMEYLLTSAIRSRLVPDRNIGHSVMCSSVHTGFRPQGKCLSLRRTLLTPRGGGDTDGGGRSDALCGPVPPDRPGEAQGAERARRGPAGNPGVGPGQGEPPLDGRCEHVGARRIARADTRGDGPAALAAGRIARRAAAAARGCAAGRASP